MTPRPPMKNRVIRVPEGTWQAALDAAEQKQEVLSEEIRRFVEKYPTMKKGKTL